MSGSLADRDQQNLRVFNDRLARIEQRAIETQQQVRKQRAKKRSQQGGLLRSGFALVSDGLAVMAARLLRAEMFGADLTGVDAQAAMINDALLALAVALLVKTMFRFNLRQFVVLQTAGATLMLLGMHNLVHLAPDTFAEVFPKQWVSAVLVETAPNSLLISGASLTF